jgi:hypothetical protein
MEFREQRKYERTSFSAEVAVRDLETGQTMQGRSIDLSRSGLGFFASHFMEKGTRVRVSITFRLDGRPTVIAITGTIMRSTTEGDGGVMGVQFDTVLSPLSQPRLCQLVDSRT